MVAVGAEEVAGVEVAFLPGFFGGLFQLPVVEAGAEVGADWLVRIVNVHSATLEFTSRPQARRCLCFVEPRSLAIRREPFQRELRMR